MWRHEEGIGMSGLNPLISVITATYNAAQALPYTMQSICKQSFEDFEWIVMDGGSTDGTTDLLEECARISYWRSERDRGIYDAWNKAVRQARGQWVIFIGAGDEFASDTVLEEIAPILTVAFPAHSVVYGKVELVGERDRNLIEIVDRPWDRIKGKWQLYRPVVPVHPETFQHRSLFVGEEPFDLRFSIASDTHFLLKAFQEKEPLYIPLLIDRMTVGGVSTRPRNYFRMVREIWAINADLGIELPFWHVVIESMKLLVRFVIELVPTTLSLWIIDRVRILRGKKPLWNPR